MKNKTRYFLLLAGFVLCCALGVLHDRLYRASGEWELPVAQFQRALVHKEQCADTVLRQLAAAAEAGVWPKGDLDGEENCGIVYFVFRGDKMVFWSDNTVDLSNVPTRELTAAGTRYCEANNACGVVKAFHFGDNAAAVAFIVVKYRYAVDENPLIENRFATGFAMDRRVLVDVGAPDDADALFSVSGDYLFSLSKGEASLDKLPLEIAALCLYGLAYLLFLLLFVKLHWQFGANFWSLRNYLGAVSLFGLVTVVCVHFGVPHLLFAADLFSPLYYASNLMPSLGHLAICSALLCAIALVFYVRLPLPIHWHATAKVRLKFAVAQLVTVLIIFSVDYLLHDLVGNSSFDLVFVSFEQVSIHSVLASLLVFIWVFTLVLVRDKLIFSFRRALSLTEILLSDVAFCLVVFGASCLFGQRPFYWEIFGYLVVCCTVDVLRYRVHRSYRFWQVQCLTLVCCLFVLSDVYMHTLAQKRVKYAMIAENLASGAKSTYDIYTKKRLADLETQLIGDQALAHIMATRPISMSQLLAHLNQTSFRNYWNDGVNYTMKVFTTDLESPSAHRYDRQIAHRTLQPYTDHFYINHMKSDSYQFVGIFDFAGKRGRVNRLFVVLYRTGDMSDSDIFSRPQTNINLLLSAAVYKHGEKSLNSGVFVYPNLLDEVPVGDSDVIYWHRFVHHVFRFADDTCVLVGERHPEPGRAFLIYWTYLFLFYFLLVTVAFATSVLVNRRLSFQNTFVAHIQRMFVIMSVLFITMAFVTSLFFIYTRYRSDQKRQIEEKTLYIQAYLQPYIQHVGISPESLGELAFFLQDLSKLYRTDIHVYNPDGELMATSRPYLLTSGLCGRRINPAVFFAPIDQSVVVEERIGRFDYLASYATTHDGDGKTASYICVPMFFSSYNLWRDLFFYCALLMNLYFVALLLAALIALAVGRRLTHPLKTLGLNLRQIRLDGGKANEKISYNGSASDEIGMLVTEYNHMVDKLAESAQQLAASERELAWRDMARQIAHEIKNPLTPMKLTIQQLQRTKAIGGERFDDYFATASRTLIEQIDTLSFIASEFSNFARMPMANLTRVDLYAKLRAEVELFRNNHENVEISYSATIDEAFILADGEQMTQLFNNLLKNAIQAIPSTRRGKIDVVLTEENGRAVVSVTDNGCGISDEVAERIFTPNFTTKSSGMGLGLCIAKNIVMMSQGEIAFTTKQDEGTTFVVKFPLIDRP